MEMTDRIFSPDEIRGILAKWENQKSVVAKELLQLVSEFQKYRLVAILFIGSTLKNPLPRLWIKDKSDIVFRSDLDVAMVFQNPLDPKTKERVKKLIEAKTKKINDQKILFDCIFDNHIYFEDLEQRELRDFAYSVRNAMENHSPGCLIWRRPEPIEFRYPFRDLQICTDGVLSSIRYRATSAYVIVYNLLTKDRPISIFEEDKISKFILLIENSHAKIMGESRDASEVGTSPSMQPKAMQLEHHLRIASEIIITKENVQQFLDDVQRKHLEVVSYYLKERFESWRDYIAGCINKFTSIPEPTRKTLQEVWHAIENTEDFGSRYPSDKSILFEARSLEERKAIFDIIMPFFFYSEAKQDKKYKDFVKWVLGISKDIDLCPQDKQNHILQLAFLNATHFAFGVNVEPVRVFSRANPDTGRELV